MKRAFLLIFSAACVFVLCHGCYQLVVGSFTTVDVSKNITGFNKIDLDDGCKATISYSDEFSINITINDNIEPYLIVEQKRLQKKLHIYLDPKHTYENLIFEAEITLPSLVALELEDASEADIDGFDSSNDFDAVLLDGSVLTGNLIANDVNLQAVSNSNITLTGQCTGFALQANDNCTIDLVDFPATGVYNLLFGATIQLDSNTTASVTTCKGITAQLNDSCILNYYGSPIIVNQTMDSIVLYRGRSEYCN